MRKLSFIFLFSTLLLWQNYSEQHHYIIAPFYIQSQPMSASIMQRSQRYERSDLRALALSYNFGINQKLTREQKALHQRLALKHLFSPSGLHFSYLFGLIFWLKRKRGKGIHLGCCLLVGLLGLASFTLPSYYPLKRTLLFSFLSLSLSLKFRIKTWWIFLFTFLLDGLFGSYIKSPLSFTYSFLFWGIIISEKNFTRRIFYLFLAQMLVSYFQTTVFYPLSSLANLFILPLFSLLFPFILFGFFSPWIQISENALALFQKILIAFDAYVGEVSIIVPLFFVVIIVSFFSLECFRMRKYFFLILILIPIELNPPVFHNREKNFFQRGYLRQKKGIDIIDPSLNYAS